MAPSIKAKGGLIHGTLPWAMPFHKHHLSLFGNDDGKCKVM
jgi:hypothetical protein